MTAPNLNIAAPAAIRGSLTTHPALSPLRPTVSSRQCRNVRAIVHVDSKPPDTLAGEALSEAERDVYKSFFVDEQATERENAAERASFPFNEEQLIDMARLVIVRVLAMGQQPSLLADDFEFVGPVVGPLPKHAFLTAFASFNLFEAFPDAKSGVCDFRVDPFQPNRVWYTARFVGKHTGALAGTVKPTGVVVEAPPQSNSLTFNAEGKVTKLTAGYSMDRQIGNSGGLGGVFGLFYAVGAPLPFREARPWRMSLTYRFFNKFGALAQRLQQAKN